MVKRVLQDNKVLGTSVGTTEATAPGPAPTGSASGFFGESWVNGSLPCQTRFEQHRETWLLEVTERGIRMETVDAGWGELRVGL